MRCSQEKVKIKPRQIGNLKRRKADKRFEIALQTRNFEIGLFWQRSLFFWGFIAAAFVTIPDTKPNLRVIVACFGMVCSCAWTLLNRGSKYWQETWETRLNENEDDQVGDFFKLDADVKEPRHWFGASKFSVSKLVVALSDYVFFLWLAIVTSYILPLFCMRLSKILNEYASRLVLFGSLVYLIILLFCRKSKENNISKSKTMNERHMKYSELNPENKKLNNDAINRRWKQLYHLESDSGERALKYLLYTNSGGAIATLSFLGAFPAASAMLTVKIALVLYMLGVFFVGIINARQYHHMSSLFKCWKKDVAKYQNDKLTWDQLHELDDARTVETFWDYFFPYVAFGCFIVGSVSGGIGLFC